MKGKFIEPGLKIPIRAFRRALSVFLSGSMILGTFSAAIPVFAQKGELDCHYEIHEHDDSCYVEELTCGKEEGTDHHHDDDCYSKVLDCGEADFVVHSHDSLCYDEDGDLICPLPEIEVHEHDEDCYFEKEVLDCGQEEGEEHSHDASCYRTERTLICRKPEIRLHTHDESCYDKDGVRICHQTQVLEHSHDEGCLLEEVTEDPEEKGEQEDADPDEDPDDPATDDPGDPAEKNDPTNDADTDGSDDEKGESQPESGSTESRTEEADSGFSDPSDLMSEMTPLKKAARASEPTAVIIEDFKIRFSQGGTLSENEPVYVWDQEQGAYVAADGSAYIWNPSDPVKEHKFIYRLDYTVSGTFSSGGLSFTLPLHILKDREGSWADEFECPYLTEDQKTDSSDFVYRIDEEAGTVTIYNVKELPAGAKGYIEVSWTTTKTTLDYYDMGISIPVNAVITATGSDGTKAEEKGSALPVGIDTHATIAYTRKLSNPSYYTSWQNSWGMAKPEDADDSYYLVWTVYTMINKNTSTYHFSLEDTFTSLDGEVVGYRFSGQQNFSPTGTIENVTGYGGRYDYVLVRYSKAEAEKLLQENDRYEVRNDVRAIVDPIDQVDPDTDAVSYATWFYEIPKYVRPTGHFWAEKYGLYPSNGGNHVRNSNDISSYSLTEFVEGKQETISGLRYEVYVEGYPYPWTADAPLTGTEEDADKYGQKAVDYHLVDERFELENEPLNPEDYDIMVLDWAVTMKDARYDPESKTFREAGITYTEDDKITFSVKLAGSDAYVKAAVYDMKTQSYSQVDKAVVKSASGRKLEFTTGVKGYRIDLSNAHYYTRITAYPSVTLNRNQHTLELTGNVSTSGQFQKAALTNYARGWVTQDEATLFTRDLAGRDYIQAVVRNGELKKDVASTRNDKVNRVYHVTWNTIAKETYRDDGGIHYVPQECGVFYDLLPYGGILERGTITVRKGTTVIDPGYYTVQTIDNYKDSGRTMMIIRIDTDTKSTYSLTYATAHSWDSMQDYGKTIHNSVAYETGNEDIADGLGDTGGSIKDKDLMKDLDPDVGEDDKKFLYGQATYDTNILLASDTGLMKKVRGENDLNYSYASFTTINGSYSYQVRLANDAYSQASDIIFFDSLENFYQSDSDEIKIDSDWHGTLQAIDVSQLRSKGIEPRIYVSAVEELSINKNHDLTDSSVWTLLDAKTDLSKVKAVAVDARKTADNEDFILGAGDSLAFTLYMQAPASEDSESERPTAYNNIYVESRSIHEYGGPSEITLYHQDYTRIEYRVSGDILLRKVNAEDTSEAVPDAIYELTGTSQYGTEYSVRRATNKNGEITFTGIEKGKYVLKEVQTAADWLLDQEIYKVEIDRTGRAIIDGQELKGNEAYVLEDHPRIHGDITFLKVNSLTGAMVEGAEFRLTGTSDYGNDILKYAVSQGSGVVSFTDIELGTYTLTETKTPDGFVPNELVLTLKVDEWGVVSLYRDGEQISIDQNGYYRLENEPLHDITFVKSSTYGTNIYLEGAEFELTGTSDLGTEVKMTAVSGAKENLGRVTFEGLEPGTYELKEITAPSDDDDTSFNLDQTVHIVVLKPDGTYTITGLEQMEIEDSEKVYDFKDVPEKGMIVVTKRWEDDLEDEDRNTIDNVPDITITTDKPSGDGKAYWVTFDAGDGTFTDGTTQNRILYTSDGKPLNASGYKIPEIESDTQFFGGWLDEKGNPVECDGNGNLTMSIQENITLKANWKTPYLTTGDIINRLILKYKEDQRPSGGYISGAKGVYVGIGKSIPQELADKPVKPLNGGVSDISEEQLLDVSDAQDGSVLCWGEGTSIYIEAANPGKKIVFNKDSSYMFSSGKWLTMKHEDDVLRTAYYYHSLETVSLGRTDTSRVTYMYYMFNGCSSLTELSDLSDWDTSRVTTMSYMFKGCSSLTELSGLRDWDTSRVTTMSYMFCECRSLIDISALREWDTSNVTNMYELFCGCRSLTDISALGEWDMRSVTNMQSMFRACWNLTDISALREWDTSNVTNMSYMFYACDSLIDISALREWDTSNVTNMSYMFTGCILTDISALGEWDTSNVTNMSYMFSACNNLTDISALGEWDTSSVTNMSYMFSGCSSLADLSGLSKLDTSSVTNISYMFRECSSLTDISVLSDWDTSSVTSMGSMFFGCRSLMDISALSNWDTSSVTGMNSMFSGCSSLISLDLSNFDISNISNMTYMFNGCSSLKTIYASDWYEALDGKTVSSTSMFSGCTSLIGTSSSGGTVPFDSSKTDLFMARPAPDGYFTDPSLRPDGN